MLKIYSNIKKNIFNLNYLPYIFTIFLVVLFARGFPLFSKFYLFVPVFFVIFNIFFLKEIIQTKYIKNLVFFILLFTLWAILSTLWSRFPFFTIKRSFYFLLVGLGSVSIGYKLGAKNNIILNSFLIVNLIIVFISLYSLIFNIPDNAWSGGHGLGFMGFNNHQNKLGQYIYITAAPLILFYKTMDKKYYFFFLLILLVNLVIIALTVSRAAILSLFIVWIVYGLLNFSFLKSIILSLIFWGIILTTVLITANYTSKNNVTIVKDENYLGQRREETVILSWQAALNGGLFGLGYGVSDERFKPELLGYYDKTSEGEIYRREKTVSVLALIEEVGIVGLSLFLLILLYPLKILWRLLFFNSEFKIQNLESKFLLFTFAFLISLNIYGQIESWWIGIGTVVMPTYFIFIGASFKELGFDNRN